MLFTELRQIFILDIRVFNLPGMGKSLILAIANRDFNVVQTIVMYIAVLVIVMNFIVDILYKKLDPRID